MILPPQLYLALVVAFLLGTLATWVNRALALRFGLVSHPNPIVPQHLAAVAHLGGIGIGVTIALVLMIAALLGTAPTTPLTLAYAVPALGFLLLGSADDLRPLTPQVKLGFQVLLAGLAVLLGGHYPWTGHPALDFVLSALWIVVLVNAVNVTDVCDGFATGIAAVVFLCWGHLASSQALLSLVISGACCGFLVFNFPPASIFLGDAGSHLLGFSLAYLTLAAPVALELAAWVRPAQMVLVGGVFLFEVALLVTLRHRKGIPWYRGSPDHTALRLQAAGLTRRQTDAIGWGAAVLLCASAALLDRVAWPFQLSILAVVIAVARCCWKRLERVEVTPR